MTRFEGLLFTGVLLLGVFLVVVREVLRSRGLRASLWPWPTMRDFNHLDDLIASEQNPSRRRRLWWFRVAVYCVLGSFVVVALIMRFILR